MTSGYSVGDKISDRCVEVDAARLLLLLVQFGTPPDDASPPNALRSPFPTVRHFTPEYRLQKLDFLLRYPSYFAYELIELVATGRTAAPRPEVAEIVRSVLGDREPELLTLPFRKFWRGAYERLDDVEAWWLSRRLVAVHHERRGGAPPQKHYLIAQLGLDTATRLANEVKPAQWYAERISLLYRFFGTFTSAEIKNLQYAHPGYREAQLDEVIPDLRFADIASRFEIIFEEELGVSNG